MICPANDNQQSRQGWPAPRRGPRVEGQGYIVRDLFLERACEGDNRELCLRYHYVRVDQPKEGQTVYHGEFVPWNTERSLPDGARAPVTIYLPLEEGELTTSVYRPEVPVEVF
ncbi:MAG: hypothetical protein AB1758_06965 [Candidatus Eremiobacterota bacterium]